MGRVSSAGDTAAMESFNVMLQNNVLDTQRWEAKEDLHSAVMPWSEQTYHRRRRQRSLAEVTPTEFEALALALKAS